MPRTPCLIVGLGNPGAEYDGTRHNIGFEVVDRLAETMGEVFERGRAEALVTWGRHRGRDVGLAKPLTYMNRSGTAVKTLLRLHDVDLRRLLVIYDDLNLPVGALRLRPGGSAGGHNGVQDIIDRLGTDQFARLRVGIGSDFARGQQVNHVLSPFDAEERTTIDAALPELEEAVLTFVTSGITTAMNRHNRRGS